MCTPQVQWMQEALSQAAQAYGSTTPNPMVGAVLVQDGRLIGAGCHRRAGEPHAEVVALEAARAQGMDKARGAVTLYCSLEPCNHHGRTPPCTNAILASPVSHVVAAMVDPNPEVSGRGIATLRDNGVRVDVGMLGEVALELNHVFVARQLRGRVFVALKIALSADGCIAAAGGAPAPITGEAALQHAHWLRAGHDAILVGVETLRRDRPRLDRRYYAGPGGTPRRLVLDPRLRLEPDWLHPGAEKAFVLCARATLDAVGALRAERLAAVAEVVSLPGSAAHLELAALPDVLERLGLWSVLVEGGGETQARFLAAGLWDRVYVYRNPNLRLAGLPWAAATVWRQQASLALCLRREWLGPDQLEVYVHPGTLPNFGTAQ